MELDQAIGGWRYLGQTKDGVWGKFVPEGDDRYTPVPRFEKPREPEKRIVPDEQKDKSFRMILNQIRLGDRTVQDFQRRNLNPSEIEFLSTVARTLGDGYLIPFPNAEGQFVGAQKRLDNAEGGRYRWYYIHQEWSVRNEFDELPLAVWQNGNPVWIVEGTGVKPAIASQRFGVAAIGSAGGLHHSSIKTLKHTLEVLGNPVEVVLCPDAGDVVNHHVIRRIHANLQALSDLGVAVTIAWWRQFTKAEKDIDELDSLEGVQYLTPAEFWALVRPEWRPVAVPAAVPVKPKSKAQQKREWRAIQADITRMAISKPFGDRPFDVVCKNQDELKQALRNHTHCFIDGPTGSGKTESFAELMRDDVNHIGLAPLQTLAQGMGASHGLPFWNEHRGDRNGILDGVTACVHSVISILSAKKVYPESYLYIDEVEDVLSALLQSSLCEDYRGDRIEAFRTLLTTAQRVVAASATATTKDLEYLQEITGKRFTLIRFEPTHTKGELTIYSSVEGKTGTDRAAYAYVQSLVSKGKRQHIASDSKDQSYASQLLGGTDCLLMNQDTKEDRDNFEMVQSFNPSKWWLASGYRSLVSSPTLGSGFSLKGDLFDEVLGIYMGKSIPPASCVQSFERYRSDVPRIVYAPRYSTPPGKLTTGHAPVGVGGFKERQAKQWEIEADHLENTVTRGAWADFQCLKGAERKWYRDWEIQRDREFRNFALSIACYAERQGYTVQWGEPPENLRPQNLRDQVNDVKSKPIVHHGNDRPLDKDELLRLLAQSEPSREDRYRIDAYGIRDYYGKRWDEPLTQDEVIDEGFGRGRKALVHALRLLWVGQAEADDTARRAKVGDKGYLWDMSNHALSLEWWDKLGVDDLLAYCMQTPYSSLSAPVREFADRLASHQSEIGEGSRLLGVKIPWRFDDAQSHYGKVVKWIGEQFKRLGISTTCTRPRDEQGNVLPRVYQSKPEDIERLRQSVGHKAENQMQKGFQSRSTPLFRILYPGVDQTPKQSTWEQYLEALRREDLPEIQRLITVLDSEGEEF